MAKQINEVTSTFSSFIKRNRITIIAAILGLGATAAAATYPPLFLVALKTLLESTLSQFIIATAYNAYIASAIILAHVFGAATTISGGIMKGISKVAQWLLSRNSKQILRTEASSTEVTQQTPKKEEKLEPTKTTPIKNLATKPDQSVEPAKTALVIPNHITRDPKTPVSNVIPKPTVVTPEPTVNAGNAMSSAALSKAGASSTETMLLHLHPVAAKALNNNNHNMMRTLLNAKPKEALPSVSEPIVQDAKSQNTEQPKWTPPLPKVLLIKDNPNKQALTALDVPTEPLSIAELYLDIEKTRKELFALMPRTRTSTCSFRKTIDALKEKIKDKTTDALTVRCVS